MGGRVLSLLIGYFLGCILTAEIVCRACTGKSSSKVGTGNPGMANIMANVGKKQGFIVLLGDIVKTALAMFISWLIFARYIGKICIHYAGLGTVLGHNFPFWRKFKGGKGVTCTCTWLGLGFWTGFVPWGILCDLTGAITVLLTGFLPLGALVICAFAIPMAFLVSGAEVGIMACVSFGLMVLKNREGIVRILKGEEKTTLKLAKRKKNL